MKILLRKWMILSMMLLTSVVIVSCSGGDDTSQTTEPTTEDLINHTFDMDTVYFEGEGFSITYKQLYDSIKTNDGADQLVAMVDRMILVDYLALVTEEDINQKREKLIYGTTDQEVIDGLTDQKIQEMITAYNDGMTILGFADNDEPYLELLVARDLYVKNLLTNTEIEDNNLLIDHMDVAEEYTKRRIGDVRAIVIRYDSLEKVSSLLRNNNLVEYNRELRLYTDENVPLKDAVRFNDDNTRTLTDQELIDFFIKFYNDVYSSRRNELVEGSSLNDLLANDDLSYQYADLKQINVKLADLLFSGISTMIDRDNTFYTFRPYEVKITNRSNYYLVLNLDREYQSLTGFNGNQSELIELIGADVYEEIFNDLVEGFLSDNTFIGRRLKTLRENHGFEIYDYYLKLDYENVVPKDMSPTDFNRSDFVIAKVDGEEILVKDLLAYALERKAPLYLLHAAQLDILRDKHFENVYCDDQGVCELDYTKNNSGAMNAHIAEYLELEKSFKESQYSNFYTFEDYLYLAYGAKNDVEMFNHYVRRTLEPLFIYDQLMANSDEVIADMMEIINQYYDDYFSLNVRHLLIYMDDNGDGKPDDYDDFYEGLEDKASFDQLILDFQAEIMTFLEENDDNLALVVSTFESADTSDEVWGPYKRGGLRILTENLSSSKSLTYMNSNKVYEEEFVEGLKDLYQQYILEENQDLDFMYNDQLIQTSFGLHLVKAEKGDDFDMPSAEFTVSEDTSYNYPEGLNNTEFRISASQIEVYFSYRIFDIVSTTVNLERIYDFEKPDLPSRIKNVIDLVVRDLYDAYFITAYLNIAMIDVLETGEISDDSIYSFYTEVEMKAFFDLLVNTYSAQMLKPYR